MDSQQHGDVELQTRVKHAIDLTKKARYEDALEVFEKNLINLSKGSIQDKRVAASAFSFYGVCIAMVRRKYHDAVKYCNISLKANFMDPDHRANLALVYLERNERRKAVETLNSGLRLQPNNTMINMIFDRIGRRQPPVIAFLPRENPLNVWLGKRRFARRHRFSRR